MHHHHHHDHHDHCHGHAHGGEGRNQFKRLRWVFFLTLAFLLAEIVGGLLSNSLALLADAGHMFGDSTSLGIAMVAAWIAQTRTSPQKTFGYYRMEILAAFVNGLLLLVATLIFLEGWQRFQAPEPVNVTLMLPIAIGGLLINIVAAWILHAEQHSNLNIKGAYLHVMGDLLGSIGAITASVLIMLYGWYWADPLISAIIAVLVFISAIRLIRDAANILLEGAPLHIDVADIEREILSNEGIFAVHNLHVWNINVEMIILTAHLVVAPEAFSAETLSKIQSLLKRKFGLSHVTLQLEVA